MALFWTPEAIADREGIYDYIEAGKPAAALSLDELFSEKAWLLINHPGLGRQGRVTGTRELVVHPNYLFVDDMVDERVRILPVLHAAMHWSPSN
jgi:plasmid stabilization system protein ParE